MAFKPMTAGDTAGRSATKVCESICESPIEGNPRTVAAKGNCAKDEQKAKAVRELLDRSLESKGVVDIFAAAGIEKADISILAEKFLEEFKSHEHENLRLKLLAKILADEIRVREKMNLAKYRSFKEMLGQTLQKYHNRVI
jgi:type I restriction enzyme R subunit